MLFPSSTLDLSNSNKKFGLKVDFLLQGDAGGVGQGLEMWIQGRVNESVEPQMSNGRG